MNRFLLALAFLFASSLRAEAPAEAHAEASAEASEEPSNHAAEPEKSSEEKPAVAEEHAAAAHATPAPAHGPNDSAVTKDEEMASMLRIGHKKLDASDFESAEIAFRGVLTAHTSRDNKREALIGLARTYRKKGEFTKAVAVYEKTLKEFPDCGEVPMLFLELGRTQRTMGAYKQAIARFYNVINSTLKLPESGADTYRQLARTAQFEIAETYFQSGDYEQANRFFSRLKLLDLSPEDRARAHFKSAYALILGGNDEKAVISLRGFLEQYPNDENVPEARYLLSSSLQKLGQSNESLAVALDILRTEKSKTQKDPKRWAYWQRKTGNSLANAFYERGDFNSALVIYESLSKISEEPAWRLPVTYQIGLCSERLQLYERARECYQTIIDTEKAPTTDVSKRSELSDLSEMATWRLNQLAWYQDTQKEVAQLFPKLRSEPRVPPTDTKPAHDANGSDKKPSAPVR